MTKSWYDQQIDKIQRQQDGLLDRHNTNEDALDLNDVQKLLNSGLRFTPKEDQSWQDYVSELVTHIKYADDKNTKTHVEGKRQWYTHRSPLGCFMCEDIALRHVMLRVLQIMAKKYPKNTF